MSSLQAQGEAAVRTDCGESRIHYVVGKVEEAIPQDPPASICAPGLDTGWHRSTLHELERIDGSLFLARSDENGCIDIEHEADRA